MTAVSALLAGTRLTAAGLQGVAPLAALKGTDESVTSSTALQNDDALYIPVVANAEYMFILLAAATGAAIGTGDIKVALAWPAGSSGLWWAQGFALSGTTPAITHAENTSGNAHGLGVDGTGLSPVEIAGSLITGGTPGNLQLEWAQNTSSGTATKVKAGSLLLAWQVA